MNTKLYLRKLSLKKKLFLITLVPLFICALLNSIIAIQNKVSIEHDLLENRLETYVAYLESGELSFESVTSKEQLEGLFNEKVLHAMIVSRDGFVLYGTDNQLKINEYDHDEIKFQRALEGYAFIEDSETNGQSSLAAFYPLIIDEQIVGVFHVELLFEEFSQRVMRYALFISSISILLMLFAFVFIAVLSQRFMMSRISHLQDGMDEVIKGNFSYTLCDSSADEIGQLVESFNTMIAMLDSSRKKLEEYNKSLENQVVQRTDELQRKVLELENAKRSLEEAKQVLEEFNKHL
jgi:methyl-accepting chemotaxis protein